jgi:hypothetical protein
VLSATPQLMLPGVWLCSELTPRHDSIIVSEIFERSEASF